MFRGMGRDKGDVRSAKFVEVGLCETFIYNYIVFTCNFIIDGRGILNL